MPDNTITRSWPGCTIAEHEGLQTKLAATRAVLAEREAELLKLKGPCSSAGDTRVPGGGCAMHYAHRGPCMGPPIAEAAS